MMQVGKMAQVAGEIVKYEMDVVALQEIRWRGDGRVDKKNYSLFYSGPETMIGQYGTGFIINPENISVFFFSFLTLGATNETSRLKARTFRFGCICCFNDQ
jgi:hypothetical protein